jgi:uncharacterized protein (DUF1499 family)
MKQLPLLSALFVLLACSGNNNGASGIDSGKLPPCPDKHNCVSSQSADQRHAIDPLYYNGSKEKAKRDLIKTIETSKRARVVRLEGDYIHAEFTSAFFRFVDDVDFILDDHNKTIHLRSASRVGYSDMGVNRRRVKEIRARFHELSRKGAK